MEQEKVIEQTTTSNSESQEELYRKETHCHSCGRFVGIYTRCPYCLALTQKRLSIRVFKVISVLISTVGLIMLLFYARKVQTSEVKISEIGPLTNFAHVRVVGEVETSYGIHPKWGSLYFILKQTGKDGEKNTIRLSAYSKVAKEIQAKNLVPQKGDVISVEGQVRFQKNTASMLINAAEHIAFIKRLPPKIDSPVQIKTLEPSKITNEYLGQLVNTTGSVIKTNVFKGKGITITIDNGTALGFPVWLPDFAKKKHDGIKIGDLIEATGKIALFRGKPQITVGKEGIFKIISSVNNQTSGSN